MKRIGIFAVLMVMAFMTIAGLHLTFHAGEVDAVVAGDSNMRNRYNTASTTPISDLDNLNGVTSNVQTQLDAKTTSSLAIANAFVGSSAGVATAKSVTIVNDVTATMDENGILNATIPASTITSAMIAIANVTADDIGAAAVNSPKLDKYTMTLTVGAGSSINTVTGDASDFYTGVLLTTVGGINGLNLTNDLYYDGFGNYTMAMVNAVSAEAVYTLGFINAN